MYNAYIGDIYNKYLGLFMVVFIMNIQGVFLVAVDKRITCLPLKR